MNIQEGIDKLTFQISNYYQFAPLNTHCLPEVVLLTSYFNKDFIQVESKPSISRWLRLNLKLSHTAYWIISGGYIVPSTERLREHMQRITDYILSKVEE